MGRRSRIARTTPAAEQREYRRQEEQKKAVATARNLDNDGCCRRLPVASDFSFACGLRHWDRNVRSRAWRSRCRGCGAQGAIVVAGYPRPMYTLAPIVMVCEPRETQFVPVGER